MALAIRRFPDPILKRPTHPVERVDAAVRKLVEQMAATMCAHPRCVGLAAPQVGSTLRIAVMDSSRNPKVAESRGLIILVNPHVTAAEGAVLQREGCLSIPDFTGNVQRAARVRIRAHDQDGQLQEFWLEGFEAIIAQHEIDHLDGKLFLDRVANLKTDVFRRRTSL
ncbi:MAG: peptide deformylase [Candidatus Omnitrophica bacterium]|nr:peptide deformylase [Candidatus Omnitrophota bacterium]